MSIGTFPFSQAVVDIIATDSFYMIYAVELEFDDITLRLHTGIGDLSIGGNSYIGVGDIGRVNSSKEDDSGVSPLSVTLSLSGLNSDVLSGSIDGARGRSGTLYFVVADTDGNEAVDVLFNGRMDAAKISYGGNNGDNAISVTLVDELAEWSRAGVKRWTDESHKSRYSGDRFFYAMAQLADSPIYWGYKKDAPAFSYTEEVQGR